MPYLLESCGNTFILIWLESFCSFDSYITLEKSIYYATFYLGCFHSVTRASWFSGHRFKLETQNFIFHILHRNFPNFGMKILVLCSAKSLQSFSFFFFCFLIQSLFKTFPKLIYVFLFLFLSDISCPSWNNWNNWNCPIETTSYFPKTSILTNKAPLVLIFSGGYILHAKLITCQLKEKITN